jgi:hypothetical protein
MSVPRPAPTRIWVPIHLAVLVEGVNVLRRPSPVEVIVAPRRVRSVGYPVCLTG